MERRERGARGGLEARNTQVTVKEAICLRADVGQKLAQHMSTLPIATSWTQAVNEEPGENSAERALTSTACHGTACRRMTLDMKTGTLPERLEPPTPAAHICEGVQRQSAQQYGAPSLPLRARCALDGEGRGGSVHVPLTHPGRVAPSENRPGSS